jgi:DNA (cytosine-5)-methyltransferase 1
MNYYNEIDPYAAQWLRNLIAAGHIAHGIVDERSITDVKPADLANYTQCHFFAGIGVWSHALRQSGWPDSRPVWTGSCPCQPFSAAGNQKGTADERHLWPVWFNLIRECRPPVIFGEQVEAAIRHGWLDLVQSDLEGEDYACGAVGIPAAGVGAPHIRQRLFFMADADSRRYDGRAATAGQQEGASPRLANGSASGELADDIDAGSQGRLPGGAYERRQDQHGHARCSGATGFWADCDWLSCRDGKTRPVESGTFPLAHGATARVGRLRAYGNAIVPQAAQALIEAYLET